MQSHLIAAIGLVSALLALSACVSGQNAPGTGKRSFGACSEKTGFTARASAARAAGQGGNIHATPAELAAINECAGLPAGTNMSAESAVYQPAAPIPAVPTSAALPPTVPAASAQICAQQMVGGTSYACQ
jgi:hypothetical protein